MSRKTSDSSKIVRSQPPLHNDACPHCIHDECSDIEARRVFVVIPRQQCPRFVRRAIARVTWGAQSRMRALMVIVDVEQCRHGFPRTQSYQRRHSRAAFVSHSRQVGRGGIGRAHYDFGLPTPENAATAPTLIKIPSLVISSRHSPGTVTYGARPGQKSNEDRLPIGQKRPTAPASRCAALDADGLPRLASRQRSYFVRIRGCLATVVFTSIFVATGAPARAAPMDPALERLVTSSSSACRTQDGAILNPGPNYNTCQPDSVAFKRLINQYGFAFAPTAMHSARTTGFGGLHLSLEAAYTSIDSSKDYWKKGTEGTNDSVSGQNASPVGTLQLYSVKMRKSFGFGLEATGSVGVMPKTSLWSYGADIRMSILEGFRRGIPGFIPDVAVGGGVRTITGTPELQLTVSSLDVQISKPIAIESAVVITPWVGYQMLWIFGDSNVIDFTPKTDPFVLCNYAGVNAPGQAAPTPTPSGGTEYTGQPQCANGGQVYDFNNNRVFDPARLRRQRLLLGANVRYEQFMFGVQLITDFIKPSDAQSGQASKNDLRDEKRQYTGVFELGAMF
jgi:hypothetical protein